MTDQELKDLARKYAEENPPQTEDEVLKQKGIELNAKMVFEPFLHWLTKTHCVVSRKDVKEWVENASDFMPSFNLKVAMQIGAKRLFGTELFDERSEK